METIALTVEIDREVDGRWMAEVPELSGVMAYGETELDAVRNVEALALRVLAGRVEHGEIPPHSVKISVPVSAE